MPVPLHCFEFECIPKIVTIINWYIEGKRTLTDARTYIIIYSQIRDKVL